jgi:uncharacterized membrane protein
MKNLLHLKNHKSPNAIPKSRVGNIANNPYLDWFLILCLSFLCTIVLIIYAYFVYGDTKTRLNTTNTQSADNINIISQNDLIKVSAQIKQKSDLRREVLENYSKISDPSI